MTKDYAYAPPKTKPLTHIMIWFAVGALLISMLLICLTLYHKHHAKMTPSTPANLKPTPTIATTQTTPLSANSTPNFDFYHMLTNPQQPTSPAKQAAITLEPNQYFLQMAVTSNLAGATQLVAKLGTEGYAAIIKSNENEGINRYTVLVGPYANANTATQDQNQLKALNTDSLLVNSNNLR